MNRILTMLRERKKHVSFHTPGHKYGKWDITELSFSDNLSCPTGVLRQAEDDITAILGSARSFILTDGSTCGVLSMLYASGVKKLLLLRESHKSAFNGCKLMGITPCILDREGENGLPPVMKAEDIYPMKGKVDGVFLTSPDYYGRVPDLKAVRKACDDIGACLIIDGAHGGHLKGTSLYAGTAADFWVDGVHKSMPAITQGAVVSARERAEDLRRAVDIFRTTSPNYVIMASVEYAVKAEPNEKVRAYAKKLIERYGIENDDWTKLVVPVGEPANEVAAWLESKGIYPEFCDGNYIEFYISDYNTVGELKKLEGLLSSLRAQTVRTVKHERGKTGGRIFLVSYGDAVGKTCAKTCGLFPPYIPLVSEGEIFTEADAIRLKNAKNTYGTEGGKVYVYAG